MSSVSLPRLSLLVLLALFCARPANAQDAKFALQSDLDHVWTMMAAGLVFMMQAGFLFVEAGSVRSKNSINVAHKNMMDFVLSSFCFGLIGFALMFGKSYGGVVGFSPEYALFNFEGNWTLTFFVFQMMFCGTAATIVSGAVAERAAMSGYIVLTLIIALLIYPVVGHWAWGGLLNGQEKPWLQKLGFMDFAGSTVVHSVGAWVALAAVMVIGPRIGRFDEYGKPQKMHGHSPILATFGAIILWMGWIGFNGGSTTAGTGEFARIVVNTMLAGAAGAIVQTILGWSRSRGLHRPEWLINGSLSGLVAITAGCAYVTPHAAILIGAAGGLTCYYMARQMVSWGLDDPLGAISVHGFAGAVGTVLVALFAEQSSLLAGSRLEQAGVQLLGVGTVFVYAFGLSYVLARFLHAVLPSSGGPGRGLRVSEENEREGLNVSEHDSPLGNTGLVRAMQAILKNPDSGVEPIKVEPGEDSYEASLLFNRIAERIRNRAEREKELLQTTSNKMLVDLGRTMTAVGDGDLKARMSPVEEGPFTHVPQDVNEMINSIDSMVSQIAQSSTVVDETARRLLDQSQALSSAQAQQSDTLMKLAQEIVAMRTNSDGTADKLKDALSYADQSRDRLSQSAEVSRSARERINRSWQSVERIVHAVSLIDEVAFETRLLSLNASVEAARATSKDGVSSSGASGFAVVAQEVRSLADATSQSATEIRCIVDEVQAETERAVAGVTQTDDALKAVQESIELNARLMQNIHALEEQARTAMQDMEDVLLRLNESSSASLATATKTTEAARALQDISQESREMLAKYRRSSTEPGSTQTRLAA